jgi:hypothetical protein
LPGCEEWSTSDRRLALMSVLYPSFQSGLLERSPMFGKELITACHCAIRPAEAAESGA